MNIQSHSDFQLVVSNLLTTKECSALIGLSERLLYSPVNINGNFEGPNNYVVRDGLCFNRTAIENATLANLLWKRIEQHAPKMIDNRIAIGLNERLRFYRYAKGHSFGPHTDGYFKRSNDEQSFLTLIVYLNDNFEGGETLFLKREKIINAQTGTALIFTHRQWHAGLEVKEGRKYILRTDVMFAKLNEKA